MSEETLQIDAENAPSGPMVQLRVISGPHAGAYWTFGGEATVTIGRESPSHLKLPDEKALSREHLRLWIRPPIAELTDNASRNGTWVNGVRLLAGTLTDGDRFGVGDTEIAFEVLNESTNDADRLEAGSRDKMSPAWELETTEFNKQVVLPMATGVDPAESGSERLDLVEETKQSGLELTPRCQKEQAAEKRADEQYWRPLMKELEAMQREKRKTR